MLDLTKEMRKFHEKKKEAKTKDRQQVVLISENRNGLPEQLKLQFEGAEDLDREGLKKTKTVELSIYSSGDAEVRLHDEGDNVSLLLNPDESFSRAIKPASTIEVTGVPEKCSVGKFLEFLREKTGHWFLLEHCEFGTKRDWKTTELSTVQRFVRGYPSDRPVWHLKGTYMGSVIYTTRVHYFLGDKKKIHKKNIGLRI